MERKWSYQKHKHYLATLLYRIFSFIEEINKVWLTILRYILAERYNIKWEISQEIFEITGCMETEDYRKKAYYATEQTHKQMIYKKLH